MNKKGSFVFIIALLIIFGVIALFVWNIVRNGQNNNEQTSELYGQIDNYNEYFSIQDIINEYYQNICSKNGKNVISMLNSFYVKDNNLNTNNYYDYSNFYYFDSMFFITDSYFYKKDNVYQYFISGKVYLSYLASDSVDYAENESFIFVVKDNHYSIIPIDFDSAQNNFLKYKNDYTTVGDLKMVNLDIPNKKVALYYWTYFKNEYLYNSNEAMKMLEKNSKEKFLQHKENYYKLLNSSIYEVSRNNEIFNIEFNSGNTITIKENSIMNFEITLP